MKRTWKQIGSMLLAVCMVVAMLPMVAFAVPDPTVSGFRAERRDADIVGIFFTASTTGKFGCLVRKIGEPAPTTLALPHEITDTWDFNIDNTVSGATAADVLVVYLQTENVDGVKSPIYSLEVPAYTPPENAALPNITDQPEGATYVQNAVAVDVFVSAHSTDSGTISYQWYSNTSNSTEGGTLVASSTVNGCTPSTATVGTTYYYCVVTNTNDKATTNKTATATSNIAAITVNEPSGGTFFNTATATFNLANLPTADASGGSGDTAWTWKTADTRLTLSGAGPYTFTGTASGKMRVEAEKAVSLTLNGASFTRDDNFVALYLPNGGTLTVTADSAITQTGMGNVISSYSSPLAIVLENDAVLQARSTEFAAISSGDLTLSGSGEVQATSEQDIAVYCDGDLTVGSGCTLSASGIDGIQFKSLSSGASFIISGGGNISATGTTYFGIAGTSLAGSSSLTFDFTGNLEMSGGMYGVLMLTPDATDTATVCFASQPESMLIRGDSGIIGRMLGDLSVGDPVILQNTANIPGLTEAFNAGEKVFSTGGGIPTKASISGTIKGNDINSGISGATVQLKGTSGGLLATSTTDASGQYSFDSLPVGTYRIEASAAGYRSGTLNDIVLGTSDISGKDITLTKTSGGSGGGSGGGGGGSSSGSTPPATGTSPNVDSAGTVNQTAITDEAAAALAGAAPGGTAVVRTQNATSITPATLSALADAAEGKNIVLHADTMSGNAVQGRIYVDPAKLADVKEPIKLGVYTESTKTAATTSLFEKFFSNNVATVSFEQQGSLGARLEVAAKVDLTGMDVTKLVLYSYDKATNTYRRIETPAYWVDKNGYLHFTTALAGDIIISEGPLTLKNGGVK